MVQTIRANNRLLIEKLNSAFLVTLPIFRQTLAQAAARKRQRLQAQAMEALDRRTREALEALFRTFAYDRPRAEVCCEIGLWFFQKEQYRQAAYWYALALTCARDDRQGGFVSPDCYGYLPCIQLCLCYSRLGDQKRAETFNELAAAFKPDSPAVLHNRSVFQALSE